ncbi:MAG: ATP-binding protein [Myxococcaceae bacterium]
MADAIRSVFEAFRTEADLEAAVVDSREESLYLEFKEKQDRTHGNIDGSDRKNFSKALSAFANAAGGVLIFGISSEKGADAPDHASGLKQISNAGGFLAKLQDAVLNATQPVVDDVEFRLVPAAAVQGAGYVVCFVPPSDKPPHRAMHAEREYFRRTAAGCRKLEHLDLEDMFGRRPRPQLSLKVELKQRPGDDPHEELHLAFENVGRAVAHYAGLLGEVLDSSARVAGGYGGVADATFLNEGRPCFQFVENVGVIHPTGISCVLGHVILRRPGKGTPLKLRMKWYCEGMQLRSADIEVSP